MDKALRLSPLVRRGWLVRDASRLTTAMTAAVPAINCAAGRHAPPRGGERLRTATLFVFGQPIPGPGDRPSTLFAGRQGGRAARRHGGTAGPKANRPERA